MPYSPKAKLLFSTELSHGVLFTEIFICSEPNVVNNDRSS